MASLEYWVDAVRESMSEHGVSCGVDQLNAIAKDIMVCHENAGMVDGSDVASANFYASQRDEIQSLKNELRRERYKRVCSVCKGKGRIVDAFGASPCDVCNGEGKK